MSNYRDRRVMTTYEYATGRSLVLADSNFASRYNAGSTSPVERLERSAMSEYVEINGSPPERSSQNDNQNCKSNSSPPSILLRPYREDIRNASILHSHVLGLHTTAVSISHIDSTASTDSRSTDYEYNNKNSNSSVSIQPRLDKSKLSFPKTEFWKRLRRAVLSYRFRDFRVSPGRLSPLSSRRSVTNLSCSSFQNSNDVASVQSRSKL